MNLKKALEDIYKGQPYKSSEKKFARLIDNYNIPDLFFKKDYQTDKEYDLNPTDIEFIKFIDRISTLDPNFRSNSKGENYNLDNYQELTQYIKKCISNNEFPLINDKLSKSVHTEEFLSLELLQQLSKKLAMVFAMASESAYIDYTVYQDIDNYLNKLLYTYASHSKYGKMYANLTDIRQSFHTELSDKCASYFSNNNSEMKEIKMYEGVSSYLNKLLIEKKKPEYRIDLDFPKTYHADIPPVTFLIHNKEDFSDFIKKYTQLLDGFKKMNDVFAYCNDYNALIDYLQDQLYIYTISTTKIEWYGINNQSHQEIFETIDKLSEIILSYVISNFAIEENDLLALTNQIFDNQSEIIYSYLSNESTWTKFLLNNEIFQYHSFKYTEFYEQSKNKNAEELRNILTRYINKVVDIDNVEILRYYLRYAILCQQNIITILLNYFIYFNCHSENYKFEGSDNLYQSINKQLSLNNYIINLININHLIDTVSEERIIEKFNDYFDEVNESIDTFYNPKIKKYREPRANLLANINIDIGKYIHDISGVQ